MKTITFSEPNYDNLPEIERMARIHERAPEDWIPGFVLREEQVAEKVAFLREAKGIEAVHILTSPRLWAVFDRARFSLCTMMIAIC